VRGLDFAEVGVLRVGIPAAELLKHDRTPANPADSFGSGLTFRPKLGHHAGDKHALVACPLADGFQCWAFRGGRAVDDQRIGLLASLHGHRRNSTRAHGRSSCLDNCSTRVDPKRLDEPEFVELVMETSRRMVCGDLTPGTQELIEFEPACTLV
jgi:hypothetical protein